MLFIRATFCVVFVCVLRVVFVGGSRGTSPSLDLTFPPTGLSENLGGMERGRGEKGKGGGDHLPYSPPPTGFCLKYHVPVCSVYVLFFYLLFC